MRLTVIFSVSILYSTPTFSKLSTSSSCSLPLGMEDGRIADSQVTASSSYQDNLVGATKGRLNSEVGGGAWCPKNVISDEEDSQEYLEINLLVDHIITSIIIQGRFANGLGQEYTEHYKVEYWREGWEVFVPYEDGRILRGNTNTYQTVEASLEGVIASKVRIIPFSSLPRTVCIRAELKGCLYEGINSTILNHPSLNTTYPGKSVMDDWDDSSLVGACVGILVTVVLAAISAVVLVLVRNMQKKATMSEVAHYTFLETGTSYSLQSSLTSQPDILQSGNSRHFTRLTRDKENNMQENQDIGGGTHSDLLFKSPPVPQPSTCPGSSSSRPPSITKITHTLPARKYQGLT